VKHMYHRQESVMNRKRASYGLVRSCWVLGSLAMACGGRTDGGLEDAGPYAPLDSSSEGGSGQGGAGQGGAGKNAPKGTVLNGPTSLGACQPGVPEERASSCDFVVKGLCYPTKLAACACVCPRDSQNSTCVSSFDLPSRVSCF
jgi:hypothetical protein